MQAIIAPVEAGNTNRRVANQQDALRLLLDRGVIRGHDAPDGPTVEELAQLAHSLADERVRSVYGKATRSLMRCVQLQEGLGDGLDGVVEAQTADVLNRLLRELGALDETEADEFVVNGNVKVAGSDTPATGFIVRAFDRDLRKFQPLGKEAVTNADGRYEIRYTRGEFNQGEKSNADLVVRVFSTDSANASDPPLAESSTHFNASTTTEIDLQVPDTGIKQSEFKRHVKPITPLLVGQDKDDGDVPMAALTESDIDFLVSDTGIERQHVVWLRTAFAHSAATKCTRRASKSSLTDGEIPAAVFYGWLRLGLEPELDALLATASDTLMATLESAVKQNLVPAIRAADLKRIAARIEELRLDRVLQSPPPGAHNGTRLSDLLGTLPSPLKLDQQRRIAAVVTDLNPDDPELVSRIADIPGLNGNAVGVARTLRLGALTAGHIPLAQALQLELTGERDGTLRPLAALRPDQWFDLAYAHGPPKGVEIAPAAYAKAMAANVERQYPTDALAAHVTEDRRLANQPLLADVGAFLKDNPTFDIVKANLNVLTEEGNLDAVAQPEQLVDGLRALQRMHSLNASWDETATLLENEIYSPHQLVDAGPGQLTEILDGQLAPERISALYEQAQELQTVTFAAITAAFSPLSGPQILPGAYSIHAGEREINPRDGIGPSGPSGPRPTAFPDDDSTGDGALRDLSEILARRGRDGYSLDPTKALVVREFKPPSRGPIIRHGDPQRSLGGVIDHYPTLRSLFGDQDSCVCGHCNSVLSPAAYFVDVLQFIKNAKSDDALLNELLKRRPDLQDIELSCNNTNTVLPAIDLALEILENEVALNDPVHPLKVELKLGTKIEEQLSGSTVGAELKDALKKTVRNFAGEVRATLEGDAWTVVDGRRRWKIIAQGEDAFNAGTMLLDTTDLNAKRLIVELDQERIPSGAEAAFVKLFTSRSLDVNDHKVTVAQLEPKRSWRLEYQFLAQLVIDRNVPKMGMQTPAGVEWWENKNARAITSVDNELAQGLVPSLVRELLKDRFASARITVTPAGTDKWALASVKRERTLRFEPAHLTIKALTYQSGDANADALAWPENHNPEAYVRLKKPNFPSTLPKAHFPWSLPVDLPLEEVRLFLDRARSSRLRLIELMLPLDEPLHNNTGYALEVLGLSSAEATLISSAETTSAVFNYWGISGSRSIEVPDPQATHGVALLAVAPLDQLKNVSILLQQSRLSFEELQALLATRFVSGGTAPLTIAPANTCKTSEMKLPGLTPAHLDRLHRFTRLWRKLGWTIRELDLAVEAFGGQLVQQTLISLARIQQLKQQLDLPIASVVGSIHKLETRPPTDYLSDGALVKPSLYATLFQRDEATSPTDYAAFALQIDGQELETTTNVRISDYANYIGACLGIKSSVVKAWVNGADGLGIEDKLKLDNLSRLTAAANLCRALNINPEKFTHHLKLYGARASAFQAGISAHGRAGAMLEFIKQFGLAEQAGLDVETLRYLLQHYEVPSLNANLDKELGQLASAALEAVRSIPEPVLPQGAPPLGADAKSSLQLARENAAIVAVAAGLGATAEFVADLLRTRLRYPTAAGKPAIELFVSSAISNPSTAPDQAVEAILKRLHKALSICDALKLGLTELRLLQTSSTDKNGLKALDFNTLPVNTAASFDGFTRLLALAQLRGVASTGADDLLKQYAANNFDAGSLDTARSILATRLEVDELEVTAAASQLHITTVGEYRDPIALARLIELLAALKQIGATVEQAIDLTAPSPDDAAAISARELLRKKFGESQWRELIKPIADSLRVRQRDALVDYLIARNQQRDAEIVRKQLTGADPERGADDLFEYYLIDVQTSSCLKTTRLLQATAAAQLFVQRLLLNLEKPFSLTADKRERWDWERSYRVWEANRKVFLFPENWLLPELRDDKTLTFQRMESALTEEEPSPDNTRAALLGYLEELGDLSQICVIAMYQDGRAIGTPPNQTLQRTLYVIGRTPNEAYRYFWRSCREFGSETMSWNGWEALEIDNANDFIMPFVYEGDLHVAWPIIRKTKEEKKEETDTAELWWEVQLAWTRRTSKGWVKRKIGKAQLDKVKRLSYKDEADSFVFRLYKNVFPVPGSESLTRETITIHCDAAIEQPGAVPSLVPDPSRLLNTNPIPSNPRRDHGPYYQWNVSCVVEGIVYKFFNRPAIEGGPFYEGFDGATVEILEARQRPNDQHDGPLPTYLTTTQSGGAFKFTFPTTATGRNGSEGLLNGGSFKLRIEVPGHPAFDKTVTLVKKSDTAGQPDEYSLNWTWKINYGVEDPTLEKERFDQNRPVNRVKVGEFIVETGKDLSTKKSTELLRYFSDMEVFTGANNWKSVPLQTPLSAVRATKLEGSADQDIWSFKASDGSSQYLQDRNFVEWGRHWADGQPFASSYRVDAASSISTLFRLENQKHLHLDPDANNFGRQTPYGNYNWELFLHAPLAIADHLASQQRFKDARQWLHTVFDPTTEKKDSKHQIPQFWRFLPFDNGTQPTAIAKRLTWLADPSKVSPKDAEDYKSLNREVAAWRENPFMPHLIARLRPSAYQWHTFFAYLDVLIGWGDQLFRRDTRESVNEATLLYVLAAKLLGRRPRVIRAATPPHALTYRLLQANPKKLDGFSNAWAAYAELPGVKQLVSAQTGSLHTSESYSMRMVGDPIERAPIREKFSGIETLTSLSALAFCIPQNDKVTEFYDRIENRLFNVRNCRNIDGVFRDLPLYEPPIDPLLLIRARAAGLDINDVLDDLYAPLPHYRFSFTLQKALELCAEIKSLGGALLSALEKKDAEELSLLRSSHELAMLELLSNTRKQQVAEAEANITALQQSEATILERFGQYQKLLGKPGITKGEDGLPVVEQSSSLAVSTDAVGGVSGMGLSQKEVAQLVLTAVAHVHTQAASSGHIAAGVLSLLPNIWAGGVFAGQTFGGLNLGSAATAIAKSIEMVASEASYIASQIGTFAGYERRQDEWVHQSKLALAEAKQIQKQILAAEIRKSIAEHELKSHDKQIENAEQVDRFMRDKFTNKQLFRWMSSQIAQVYFRTYQLALEQARRAERAYQYELGVDSKAKPFIQAGNWDSLKRGLLAGERLHYDLKRMECAFLERNVRKFEIEQSFSLARFNPDALSKLKVDSACDFEIPEWFFDLTYPGHYRRHIKAVRLTIPCVVGPHTNVGATLRLLESHRRTAPQLQPESRDALPLQQFVAMAASMGQSDSGVFEFSFRDERYMPFEGAGVDSKWQLSLPKVVKAFDYSTISDVILRISYTADENPTLREKVEGSAVGSVLSELSRRGVTRVLSIRSDFPDAWNELLEGAPQVTIDIREVHIPFFMSAFNLKPAVFDVLVNELTGNNVTYPSVNFHGVTTESGADPGSGLYRLGRTPQPVKVVDKHAIKITSFGSEIKDILLRVMLKR